MFSKLWMRWSFGSVNKNVRRKNRLKPPRVVPSLEQLEKRDLLTTATPNFIIEPTQMEAAAPASAGHPASPPPGSSPSGFSPSQIQNAYGFNQISFTSNGATVQGNGAGQTIAIVDAYNDPNIYNDLATFDSQYGLVNPNLTVVNQSGQTISANGISNPNVTPPANNSDWAVEESLDVEWAHAIAPGANIILVEASSDSNSSLMTAIQTASTYSGVSVVSMSWGETEYSGESSNDSYFTTPGVTYVAASGDTGSQTIYPAVSPNVLAVGGTTLTLNSSGGYGSETAWSDSGGGISAYEKLPSYQPGTYSNGSTTGTSTKRMSPDVSYDANPDTGFAVYDSYDESGWLEVGGTSDAAPQWAALVAIADQGRALNNEGSLSGDQTLSMIYQMPSSDFHDITSGSSGKYSAGSGYDLVTGRGTPIANDVIAYLVSGTSSSPPSPPSSPSPPTPAAPTNLSATAAASSQINLVWTDPTSDAGDEYLIESSANGSTGWTQIGTTTGNTYSNTGLNAGTTYYYEVLADNNGVKSSPSNLASATTTSLSPPPSPAAPTNLSATAASSSQINLVWTDPTSDAGDEYLIESSANGSTGWTQIGTTTGNTYSNTGLNAGTTYYYEVLADNNGVKSSPSNIASATTLSPPPSSGLLSDGGFESPVLTPGTYVLDPGGTPWTFSGTAGIASNGSYVTGDNLPAPQGSQVGFLSGYGSGFTQTVHLSTGTYYTISFDAANAGITTRTQQLAVAVDDTILAMGTPASTQYTSYSTGAFYVTASGNYTITFVGTNSSGGIALIDNVGLGATPFAQQGRSDSGGSAMVSLSGSPALSSTPISVGTTSPSTGGQASVPSIQVPASSTLLPQQNSNLGLLTNLPSSTNLPLIDQLFIEMEQDFIAEFNNLLSGFSALVTGLRSQTTSDPFGGSSDWLV